MPQHDSKSDFASQRLIIAGFGGQGILTAGKLLCRSCIDEGKNVTFLPSYGSEVRGGTANCNVVVSEGEIFSPAVEEADAMLILNEPSMIRFGKNISSNGIMLLNSSMIDTAKHQIRTENVFYIPATKMAADMGAVIVANIIMLGALISTSAVCRIDTAADSLKRWLEEKGRSGTLQLNLRALRMGAELVG